MNRPFRVLVVEDLPLTQVLVKANLEYDSKIQVECVESLAQALERVASGGIDVILLDLNLPDATGIDSVRAMQKQYPLVPVVVLSGQGQYYYQAIEEGAQEFLVKPQDGPAIAFALRKAIVRHKARAVFNPVVEAQEAQGEIIQEMKKLGTELEQKITRVRSGESGAEPGSGQGGDS